MGDDNVVYGAAAADTTTATPVVTSREIGIEREVALLSNTS